MAPHYIMSEMLSDRKLKVKRWKKLLLSEQIMSE